MRVHADPRPSPRLYASPPHVLAQHVADSPARPHQVRRSTGVTDVDVCDEYATDHRLLGGAPEYQHRRLRAARRLLDTHPDLTAWMTRPLEDRPW